jgi:hypothetical protein
VLRDILGEKGRGDLRSGGVGRPAHNGQATRKERPMIGHEKHDMSKKRIQKNNSCSARMLNVFLCAFLCFLWLLIDGGGALDQLNELVV